MNFNLKNRFERYLPGLRKPKDSDSKIRQFLSTYGWVFNNGNKTLGDYDLYNHAIKNVYVYRSIQVIADTLLINGYDIKNPYELSVTNPYSKEYLENVFANPEGYKSAMTYAMFHKQYMTSFELTGDAFIEVNYDGKYNILNGFKFIPPEALKWFEDTEQWGYRNKPSIRYESDELIHIYEPDIQLHNLHYGVSKLDKIREPIMMLYLGLTHNAEVVANDGIAPKSILSFDKDISNSTFAQELARIDGQSKSDKKGGTLAVKGASFQSASISNRDMDFISLMNTCRDMILTAYGVQPGKAGIRETASLGTGTGESQDKDFKDMLKAKASLIEGSFNKVLGHNGFSEIFQFNEMDIEDKLKRTQIESNMINSGVKTVNEVRNDYGLDKVPWGDTIRSINPYETNYFNKSAKAYKNNVIKSNYLSDIYHV